MTDTLSIQQTNKIRVALGLPALPVPGDGDHNNASASDSASDAGSNVDGEDGEPASTLETRVAEGYDNWNRLRQSAAVTRQRQARLDSVRRTRERAQLAARLPGKSLGEASLDGGAGNAGDGPADADMDTATWLATAGKRARKIERARARRTEAELAEREHEAAAAAAGETYTSADLKGLRVGHDLDELAGDVDGGEQVLVLKDATIDENEAEGDELESAHVRETGLARERVEAKKKRVAYDPNNNYESGSLLGQYDEEIEGKKRKRFTLDSAPMPVEARQAQRQDVSTQLKKAAVSLDAPAVAPTSDYMEPTEVKVKKPKKKKSAKTRKHATEEDAADLPAPNGPPIDDMPLDTPQPPPAKKSISDDFLHDADDLQLALSAQRRAALKRRKKAPTRPEDLARQLREESTNAMAVDEDEDGRGGGDGEDGEQPGLVLDETSEFVANLNPSMLQEAAERRERQASAAANRRDEDEDEDDVRMMDDAVARAEHEREESAKAQSVEPEHHESPTPAAGLTSTGLDEESSLNQGLGSTLAMLRQRGLVTPSDSGNLNALHRDRQRFLQDKHRLETAADVRARQQRERDRASGKLANLSARDRDEYARSENRARDTAESRQLAEVFNREYRPDVTLKYVDEHGRLLGQKEAFKHLSHQFHGKGSGKGKTEKQLKKITDERKREAMSTLDSSQHTGMTNAMGAAARRTGQAGVRLG